MARVWDTSLFAIAAVYFTVDALFSAITAPMVWPSKKRLLEQIRRRVTSLGLYQSFALST
ncbi:hypothetical protein KUL72_12190 [Bradyrhizobium arachidis]|uniref:hypothetical protein n=1 Tax=Bradyrhizobium TaxID=374 RepID=UPI00188CD4D8|nr:MULTISPECIES: hypothetical protein [Bradyrhizobium]MDN4983936.1 hypothetical protein [Bradyrhizobium sp. WYCCWR 13022]QOZ51874.1 hypothetical protein XH90_11185 [Bradyrhizobium sp. CCBAU 53338]UVO39051.1 hypothetical protein KUL72_12190 [Bradyrhizobium arachidis]